MVASTDEAQLVGRVLAGDAASIRQFVSELRPVIQHRVALALRRRAGSARGRDIHQEVEDMMQEVFESLFVSGQKKLRAWDPERGLSLRNYVGLLAEREVASIMRRLRRSPWTEDPTEAADLDTHEGSAMSPERRAQARATLGRLLDRLREELSPQGLHMFRQLFVEKVPADQLAAQEGVSRDAIYQWSSRIKKVLARLRAEVLQDTPPPTPLRGAS